MVPRQVHLHGALDALYYPEEECHDEDYDSHPERVPLHGIPPVVPPLLQGLGTRVVESLLKDD